MVDASADMMLPVGWPDNDTQWAHNLVHNFILWNKYLRSYHLKWKPLLNKKVWEK